MDNENAINILAFRRTHFGLLALRNRPEKILESQNVLLTSALESYKPVAGGFFQYILTHVGFRYDLA